MKLKELHFFYAITILLFASVMLCNASRQRQSNHILKSIKSEDGDVIDCVDMFHQPAFDHPLLKNHKIKIRPSNHPEELFVKDESSDVNSKTNKNRITQIWQLSGECPDGTIPIRRTDAKEDFFKANSNKKKHRSTNPRSYSSNGRNLLGATSGHEYAVATVAERGEYYGTRFNVTAWQPFVEGDNEFSLSQLWILADGDLGLNSIEAGWVVYPRILGDNRTRLFTYWTTDGYGSTGCWNLGCPGFVQVNNKIVIGGAIANFSSDHPFSEISLFVWMDKKQDVWWLQYNGTQLGYWPAILFNRLNDSAQLIEWGGEIVNHNTNGIHTATQMGNGQFPYEKFERASYFRNIEIMNETMVFGPPLGGNIGTIVSYENCYNISVGKNDDWGSFFYYGGPGRNSKCP
ncbi:OLC1v1001732C1 [Oldenlandia corymbosa var. corymbosa]|uniref:OLC1v1001732C1 n=1 Tax=Oldenlandia corymbosa var. corymbosa TaxID=529605 RepID=A0AAV1D746_OLDCO|nr:OLC1v1001732C1 [Oldenlandia corymbosa var. corymbosa]